VATRRELESKLTITSRQSDGEKLPSVSFQIHRGETATRLKVFENAGIGCQGELMGVLALSQQSFIVAILRRDCCTPRPAPNGRLIPRRLAVPRERYSGRWSMQILSPLMSKLAPPVGILASGDQWAALADAGEWIHVRFRRGGGMGRG
jgi:hypothetical protein